VAVTREARAVVVHRQRVPRLALSVDEAAEALSVSRDFFDEHIRHELRVVRRGRKVLVPVRELERWLEHNAALTLDPGAR
jgi:excisionase family DNA binding protein